MGVGTGSTSGKEKGRVGVFWLDSQLLLSIASLEYHSSMIADAVKKVIKAGKVSFKRLQGLGTAVAGT